jgi:hypothetical protein
MPDWRGYSASGVGRQVAVHPLFVETCHELLAGRAPHRRRDKLNFNELGAQIREADHPEKWAHNCDTGHARAFFHSRPELIREHRMWQYAARVAA